MDRSIPDFNKLEKDILKAINDDQLYWLQNDAKFRAVEQKVPTYEDFRDMVDAAHLKPLDKGETFRVVPKSVWNTANNKAGFKSVSKEQTQQETGFKLPVSTVEFVREWKRMRPQDRFSYILKIGCDRIAKLHESELSFELMGDVICVLRDHVFENAQIAIDLLQLMSNFRRFNLDTQLLSENEKTACKELFDSLNNCTQQLSVHENIFKELKEKYILAIS